MGATNGGKKGFGGEDFENSKMTGNDRFNNDPSRREDHELGIDRTNVDPIKFVSAIDSKPIYPPYLQLADFDAYLMQDAPGAGAAGDKKKGDAKDGEKEDPGATVTSTKQKGKADDVTDYK